VAVIATSDCHVAEWAQDVRVHDATTVEANQTLSLAATRALLVRRLESGAGHDVSPDVVTRAAMRMLGRDISAEAIVVVGERAARAAASRGRHAPQSLRTLDWDVQEQPARVTDMDLDTAMMGL